MTDPSPPRPPIPSYRAGEDDRRDRKPVGGAFFSGLLLASAAVGIAGCLLYVPLSLNRAEVRPIAPPQRQWDVAAGFWITALAGVVCTYVLIRTRKGRAFFLGALLGLCLCALLEGLCFANGV